MPQVLFLSALGYGVALYLPHGGAVGVFMSHTLSSLQV